MHVIDEKSCNLRNTSYDKENKVYMVESDIPVCSFDSVKEWYVKKRIPYVNPNPKSNDALFFSNKECFFIEFKNGKIDNGVNFEINKKIYDSLLILFDLKYEDRSGKVIDSISYTRTNMNYILVYNKEKYLENGPTRQTTEGFKRQEALITKSEHRDKLYSTMRKLANEEFIKFGLDQFKNYLFKNVYTYTIDEFEKEFIKVQNESM